MLIIAKHAMENETFRKIVSTQTYSLPDYDTSKRFLRNTNSLIMTANSNKYYYPYATGIKTGFTSQAKNCLIASATKDNVNLISVVLHAGYTEDGSSQRYLDTIHLFDYGFEQYGFKTFVNQDSTIHTVSVENATKKTKILDLKAENTINALIQKNGDYSNLSPTVTLKEQIAAPISEGEIIGTAEYEIDGIHYKTNLLASHDVEKSYLLLTVLLIFIAIFILLICKMLIKKRKRNLRKR